APRNEFERSRSSKDSLAASRDALKRGALTTNEALVALRELERDVQAGRAVYESFLVRARETGEQEGLDTRNVRVISPANLPLRRSWPPGNVTLTLCALFIGLLAGLCLASLPAPAPHRTPS